jgi:hypothetical protein
MHQQQAVARPARNQFRGILERFYMDGAAGQAVRDCCAPPHIAIDEKKTCSGVQRPPPLFRLWWF